MSAYIPVIIWFISAIMCFYIARMRLVKLTFIRNLLVVLLGPLALPLVFFAKPDQPQQARRCNESSEQPPPSHG